MNELERLTENISPPLPNLCLSDRDFSAGRLQFTPEGIKIRKRENDIRIAFCHLVGVKFSEEWTAVVFEIAVTPNERTTVSRQRNTAYFPSSSNNFKFNLCRDLLLSRSVVSRCSAPRHKIPCFHFYFSIPLWGATDRRLYRLQANLRHITFFSLSYVPACSVVNALLHQSLALDCVTFGGPQTAISYISVGCARGYSHRGQIWSL